MLYLRLFTLFRLRLGEVSAGRDTDMDSRLVRSRASLVGDLCACVLGVSDSELAFRLCFSRLCCLTTLLISLSRRAVVVEDATEWAG